jgi:hypothetical protein
VFAGEAEPGVGVGNDKFDQERWPEDQIFAVVQDFGQVRGPELPGEPDNDYKYDSPQKYELGGTVGLAYPVHEAEQ